MKMPASFLLAVGCLWVLFVVWLFLVIAGVAGPPTSITDVALYWSGMLVGPLALIVGAVLVLLRGASRRSGVILVGIGCVILTGFTLHNSIVGMQRKPLQAPPAYMFYAVLLVFMLLSDVAALKIYRTFIGRRS